MLSVALVSVPAPALEPLALYDDFSGTSLDPDKWVGSELGECGSDAERRIHQRSLALLYVGHCDTTSNNADCESNLQLNFTNPTAVTAIQAVITPMQLATTGCANNPLPTFALARLYGSFFNTGAPSPGSHVNDVVARIQVGRSSASMEPANVLQVNRRVYQCLVPDCLDGAELNSQDLGSITLGQSTTLTLQWDQPTHQFIFQWDSQAPVVFAYDFSHGTPPGRPNKRIDTAVDVPACMSAPRPDALIQQFIDNVLVNQSAAPNP
jgi:hypothetical protein